MNIRIYLSTNEVHNKELYNLVVTGIENINSINNDLFLNGNDVVYIRLNYPLKKKVLEAYLIDWYKSLEKENKIMSPKLELMGSPICSNKSELTFNHNDEIVEGNYVIYFKECGVC